MHTRHVLCRHSCAFTLFRRHRWRAKFVVRLVFALVFVFAVIDHTASLVFVFFHTVLCKTRLRHGAGSNVDIVVARLRRSSVYSTFHAKTLLLSTMCLAYPNLEHVGKICILARLHLVKKRIVRRLDLQLFTAPHVECGAEQHFGLLDLRSGAHFVVLELLVCVLLFFM